MISLDAKSAFLKTIGGVGTYTIPRAYYIALATDINESTGKFTEVAYETITREKTGYQRYGISGKVTYSNNKVTNNETLYFSEALIDWATVRYFALVATNTISQTASGNYDYSDKTAIAWGEITDRYGNPQTLDIKAEQLPIIRANQLAITLNEVERAKYNVSFNTNGGTVVPNKENLYCIPGEITTTKSGYVFDDWYLEPGLEHVAIPGTPLVANTTLFAKWLEARYVSFSVDGEVIFTRTVGYGRTTYSFEPSKEGYTFIGWFTDDGTFEDEFNFATPITENITLYAKFEAITE